MADNTEPVLTTEEKYALLNQSDSDTEYEDATDKLPPEDLSERLCEQLAVTPEMNQQKMMAPDGDLKPDSLESEQKSVQSTPDPVKNALPTDADNCDMDETAEDDPVASAMKDTNDSDDNIEKDAEELVIDEEVIRKREAAMTEEERESKKEEAQGFKASGNELFREKTYEAAIECYTDALMICPLCYAKERSVMYSNRAACKYKLERYDTAITDSTKALELNPAYLKALLRRAELYEKTEKLDEALADYQKVIEMDPSIHQARAACLRLPDQISERNEKMKAEMLGKLKDLGNMILKPFGMSTDNFNLQQDPNTGSYSVNFQQNSSNGR